MARTALSNNLLGMWVAPMAATTHLLESDCGPVAEITAAWTENFGEESHVKLLVTDVGGRTKQLYATSVRIFKTKDTAKIHYGEMKRLQAERDNWLNACQGLDLNERLPLLEKVKAIEQQLARL